MEVPVAHHLGAAQHICVERIRPVHILNRQSKVMKTEDTLPERCVVACCHSYYSFSTGCLGTDEICAASGRDRRAAYHPRNRVASTDRNASASLCQGDKIADWERSSQGRAAVQNSGRAKDRYRSDSVILRCRLPCPIYLKANMPGQLMSLRMARRPATAR